MNNLLHCHVRLCLVNVKWGKEKFKDIECNSDEPPELLKAQLFALSGVQPDRQKVMVKGVVIKVEPLFSNGVDNCFLIFSQIVLPYNDAHFFI